MSRPVLYDYYRSSAAYRVRIALNLKGVDYESRPVNLVESEQRGDDYRELNPQGLIPMLEIDGHRLTQRLAILVYLDPCFPVPPPVPPRPADGGHLRPMALAVAGHNHPLNHPRLLDQPTGQPR